MSILAATAGFVVFDQNKRSITQKEIQQLNEMADLKANQITEWQQRHIRQAEVLMQNRLMIDAFDLWLQDGALHDHRKQEILDYLSGTQKVQGYRNVSLLDQHGVVRISTNMTEAPVEKQESAVKAIRDRKIEFLDFHKEDDRIEIHILAPLFIPDTKGDRIAGAVRLDIDPHDFLYPLMEKWPLSSASAETLLVRGEGDAIRFLNKLRHWEGPALSLRLPASMPNLPSAMWLRGHSGISEGIDYRNVPVFFAVRGISGTPWVMIAKIDKNELHAQVHSLELWVAGLVGVFMLSMIVFMILWQRASRARLMQAEVLRAAAAERETMLAHFDYMTKFANDIVVLTDDRGNIIETNDRASLAYGYSREEFRGMSLKALLSPDSDLQPKLEEIETKGGLKFDSVHMRSDKSTFPVECSMRAIVIDGKKFFQGIIRDITERKQAQEKAFQMSRFILQVIDADPNRIFVKNDEGRFLLVNQAMADSYGIHPSEMIGKTNAEVNQNALEVERYAREDRKVIQTLEKMVMVRSSARSGEPRWYLVIKVPMEQPDGKVNVLGIAVDITDSKITEEKLAASYQELEKITTHMEVIREEEQKRIARELHDEMGAILAAQNINVSLLAEKVRADFPQLEGEVEYLAKLVADGIAAMRLTVSRLRPSLLDEVGLAFAIERYVQQFEESTGIKCNLRLPEEESHLDEKKSTAIFRIIQESLTNVAKHAEASKVVITLSEWDDSLVLTVQDNGRGFNLKNRKINTFGLLGIKERAAMVGGKGMIDSSEGRGVKIRVSMPR